jgi:hypothetical protein
VTVVFGRIGQWMLGVGAVALVLSIAAYALFETWVPGMVLGTIALIALVQGATWTLVQQRMFGSVGALRRVSETGRPAQAVVVGVQGTSSSIGSEAIAKLDLRIDGQVVRRHVRIPFNHAASIRNGLVLPVLTDPQGGRAMIVQWDRLP